MHLLSLRRRPTFCALAAVAVISGSALVAAAQATRGFDIVVGATPSGSELTYQQNLWVLETHIKPLRMIQVELTDPETGKKEPQVVWYLVYKIVNRPLDRRTDQADFVPVNEQDPEPGPPLFVPEFTLVTDDNGELGIHSDEVLPEALATIERRERRPLKNSVQVVGAIPEETPRNSKSEKAVYGVATWRGINPDADFYTVYMSGFSNGYIKADGPDGNPVTQRKTIVLNFWRPGDRFNVSEREFRLRGEPHWAYRVDQPGAIAEEPEGTAEATPETGGNEPPVN